MIAIGFVALAVLRASRWFSSMYEAVWRVIFLTFVAGWATAGAALRPRGSALVGALLGLLAYVAVGLAIGAAYALHFGSDLYETCVVFAVIWPGFLIGWLGLFGASWG